MPSKEPELRADDAAAERGIPVRKHKIFPCPPPCFLFHQQLKRGNRKKTEQRKFRRSIPLLHHSVGGGGGRRRDAPKEVGGRARARALLLLPLGLFLAGLILFLFKILRLGIWLHARFGGHSSYIKVPGRTPAPFGRHIHGGTIPCVTTEGAKLHHPMLPVTTQELLSRCFPAACHASDDALGGESVDGAGGGDRTGGSRGTGTVAGAFVAFVALVASLPSPGGIIQ